MYFKQLPLFCLLVLLHTFSYAMPVTIQGKVSNGNGLAIRVSAYSDYIAFTEELLDVCEISESQQFELSFDIVGIQKVFIQIGNQHFSFFVEEGGKYDLQIDNVDLLPKSALNKQMPLHFKWKEADALNEVIDILNSDYYAFLEENFVALFKQRNTELLKSFEKEIASKLAGASNLNSLEKVFIENLMFYQFANLKNTSRTATNSKLGESFLHKAEILYKNPGYMEFFSNYFLNYFASNKRNTKYTEFAKRIRNGSSSNEILDYMAIDPILEQEHLRELVLIFALREVYYNSDFNSLRLKTLFNELILKSKSSENQKIAGNILNQFTGLEIGSPAPGFKLKTGGGTLKTKESYKGRYVYLVFMSDNCPACESDMLMLQELDEIYRADIAIVGILVNYTNQGLLKFENQTTTHWDRLLFANNFELLNSYQVRNFPLYFLLDRNGKILLNPAKKPHEEIARYFDFLIKKDKDKAQKKDILFR